MLEWFCNSQFGTVIKSDTKVLALFVSPEKVGGHVWVATAVETPRPQGELDSQDVLDNHSHKIIGKYPSPAEAFEAVERFALYWSEGLASLERCECPEIKP